MNLTKLYKRKILISLLVILEIISIFLIYKTKSAENVVLDDVKLKEEEPNNNGFALMLQKEDGTYEESTSSTWPTNMRFNNELSGCIDVNGNIIEDAFCYVYFDIKRYCNKNEPLGECLLRRNSEIDSLNDNVEGGLYRYQGNSDLVNNNYVCFGTNDKNTCQNNTSKYMYRIIGILEDADNNKYIKLIKKEPLNMAYSWYSNIFSDITWETSKLYSGLNGSYYLENSTYISDNWDETIATLSWKYGDASTHNISAEDIYSLENGFETSVNAKVGLIYMHDYYYGLSGGNNCSGDVDYLTCKTSWLYLWQDGNYSNTSSSAEWTMTRIGKKGVSYYAWGISQDGDAYDYYTIASSYAVRPVFYLEYFMKYLDGEGTLTNPFIIAY